MTFQASGQAWPWLVSDRSRAALRSLDLTLEKTVAARDVDFTVLARHLLGAGGKRIRPALVMVAGEFGDFRESLLLKAAAALELVHVASLYHDDIVDRAPARRGKMSANSTWGNEAAALAGTYLFARASSLFAQLGPAANRLASDAIGAVCAGELAEVENAYDVAIERTIHLDILARKTASLFRLPCTLGALLADVDTQHAAALSEFGQHLGLAFQIADDALDLVGDAVQLGKPAGADLREGAYGLAVLHAVHQTGALRDELVEILALEHPSDEELAAATAAIVALGGVDAALAVARSEQRLARSALAGMPFGNARRSLENLVGVVVDRAT